ncbi:MAG: hypothetical protein JXM72_01795 [Deltaproteobacteria bacterium]|nr:hypothetical protein [Deltaproteobacteria bacterium]
MYTRIDACTGTMKKDEVLITHEVDLHEPGSIPVDRGKAVLVIDNRII